jgi:hypothetical protein
MHPDMEGFQQEKVPLLHTEVEEIFALRKKVIDSNNEV